MKWFHIIWLAIIGAQVSAQPTIPAGTSDITVLEKEWRRVDRFVPNAPPPKRIWKGEPLVHPRGIMLESETNILYVTDPGEPVKDPINKPARIVSFRIKNGIPSSPSIFFSKPGFMISAKWGFPATIKGQKQILVADQGEGSGEYLFSGRGAKVFSVPILADGAAGTPVVLWEGKPFVCPTGIALVGEVIYITDPCAGPPRARQDKPDITFPSSAIFALPASGGAEPVVLKSGAPFTSLIGICILTPGEIIVNDTDSGRLDPTSSGGRPGFAPPAGADRWVMRILDEKGPVLSSPKRTPFIEEGSLTLVFSKSFIARSKSQKEPIRLATRGQSRILPLRKTYRGKLLRVSPKTPISEAYLDIRKLQQVGGKVKLNVGSDVTEDTVTIDIDVPGDMEHVVIVEKSKSQPLLLKDNKHGGARRVGPFSGGSFGGGGGGRSFLRFTTDNAPGHGAVNIYRDEGGPVAILAKGSPLERPVSGQLSADAKTLWVVDQANGSLFSLTFPSEATFDTLFPSEAEPSK